MADKRRLTTARTIRVSVAVAVACQMLLSAALIFAFDGCAGISAAPTNALTPRAPLRINSNTDFDAAHGVAGGAGTLADPWIIENFEINGTGAGCCVYIGNTTDYFSIRDCLFFGASGYLSSEYCGGSGLMLYNVQNGSVYRNNITRNENGLDLFASKNIQISENAIGYSGGDNIYINESKDVSLVNNTMEMSGIRMGGDELADWNTHDIGMSNTVNGKPVYYWKDIGYQTGSSINPGTATNGVGQVILANCSRVGIDEQYISNVNIGVQLGFSRWCIIWGNALSNSTIGVALYNSSNNSIGYNDFSNNGHGISLGQFCNGNSVVWNNITGSDYCGVMLDVMDGSSNWNAFDGNTFDRNEGAGLKIRGAQNNSVSHNTFTSNNLTSIDLEWTRDSQVNYNTISSNIGNAIGCKNVIGSTIRGNNMSNNLGSISLSSDCYDNLIYENKFIDNSNWPDDSGTNRWNATYPYGGNYWSDYGGADEYCGRLQDLPCSDGIGDTPYLNISGGAGAQDSYPLMGWWAANPIDPAPVAEAGPDQWVTEGDSVQFNGSGSSDNFGIANYTWCVFREDAVDTGWEIHVYLNIVGNLYGENPCYIFTEPGNYAVRLLVFDIRGNNEVDDCRIHVNKSYMPSISGVLVAPSGPTDRDEINITCKVACEIDVGFVNLTYYRNGTGWATIEMVEYLAGEYRACLGLLNYSFAFFINATNANEETSTYFGNVTVSTTIIVVSIEGLESNQNYKTGSAIRITGTVRIDGVANVTGLRVMALLNGKEISSSYVLRNGTFALEFILPRLSSGDNYLEIKLMDEIKGETRQLGGIIITDNNAAGFPWLMFFFASAIVGAGAALGLATEIGKYSLLMIFLPLYSKIKGEHAQDQETRGMIKGYILANPGDNYNSIMKSLNLTNGTFAYHVKVLERESIIKSRNDGIYKRFYPYKMNVEENGNYLKESERLIIEKIRAFPGITKKDIARLLNVEAPTINYRLQLLIKRGILMGERKGMVIRYYVNDDTLSGKNGTPPTT